MKKKTATETVMEEAEQRRKDFIQSIIDRIEKIEQRLDLTGTGRTCVGTCGGKAREGSNYCQPCMDARILDTIGERLTGTAGETELHRQVGKIFVDSLKEKTAGECTCWTDRGGGNISGINDPDCPFHHPKSFLKPDLPLRARVAKANGKDVRLIKGEWHYWNPHAHGMARWVLIPRCDKIVDEAMGALEEYKKKNYLRIYINMVELGNGKISWEVYINESRHGFSLSFPQAICEAIVAHAEQQ